MAMDSPELLVQRLIAIFLSPEESPRASRMPRVSIEARLELLVAADVARVRFWAAHEDAAVRACAPRMLIDKQEVFAYLIADALGRPLLPEDDARGVGQRCDNGAAKAKGILKVKAKKDVAEASPLR